MGSTDDGTPNGVVFRFQNIGPVTDAELELGDLTLVAGRNNTGKTYIVYTLYGLLETWNSWSFETRFPLNNRVVATYHKLVSKKLRTGEASLTVDPKILTREREAIMEAFISYLSRDKRDILADIFSASADTFENASMNVEFSVEFAKRRGRPALPLARENACSIDYDGERIRLTGPISDSDRHSNVYRMLVWLHYQNFIFPELNIVPFVLSAERFGISLFYKELDFTKAQIVDLLQRIVDNKTQDRYDPSILIGKAFSRYARPVKDNISYTRGISEIKREKSDIPGEALFDGIKDMMDGYYRSVEDDIQFVSKSRGKRRFRIPLHRASSSARALSDFYFFLRHSAKKTHLLIIDEPESHLDTTNQIRLARLLVRVVRAGLKVLITTHSDYIVKEINNLIMLSNVGDDVAEKLGYEKSDRIDRSRIRAYVAEDNGLTKCRIDRFGIDMPIFDKTIDEINRVANDLASRMPHDADD